MVSVLAIDVGGTKVGAAVITESGDVQGKGRITLPDNGLDIYNAIVDLAHGVLAEKPSRTEVLAVGVGVPAILDRAAGKVVWAPNIPAWRGFSLGQKLGQELGLPCYLGFDGHLAALGEQWLGAAKDCRNVFVVSLGTGIGGGAIIDGRIVEGSVGVAGALGWTASFDREDMNKRAADIGWLESVASGPAILQKAREFGAFGSTADVFRASESGNAKAAQVIRMAGERLGVALANVVSLIGCERIVLTGGVAAQAKTLIPIIEQMIIKVAQPYAAERVRVLPAALGTEAPLFGAAKLAHNGVRLEVPR